MNAISRISVAGLLPLAIVSSADAQEGFGTVVCVGSELERMEAAGPVARILERDVQLVYRAAVDLANRDEIEAGLREQWNPGGVGRPAGAGRETPRPTAPAVVAGGGGDRRVGERFRDCAACPEMVVVPAGSFMMGSPESSAEARGDERPQHRVTIGYAFAVGVYEVTFAEWDACVNGGGCGGSSPSDYARDGDRHPVTQVNWEDAVRPVTGTSTPGSVSPGPSIDYAARCLDETGRRIGAWMKAHRARQSTKSV